MPGTFLLLGAAKAGTTSLHDDLDQHPDLCMSRPKESFFFGRHHERGLDWYRNTFFGHWQGESWWGDASPECLPLRFVPERIHALVPDARLIVSLRDPVTRAFAHWWMSHRWITPLPFRQAMEQAIEMIRDEPPYDGPDGPRRWRESRQRPARREYVETGYYVDHLRRYLALFPRERIHLLFFEDLQSDPAAVVAELCRFLEVEPPTTLDTARRNEATGAIGNRLATLAAHVGIRRLPPFAARGVRTVLGWLGDRRPTLDPADARWLAAHFDPWNRELEQLTGRDLSAWRRVDRPGPRE